VSDVALHNPRWVTSSGGEPLGEALARARFACDAGPRDPNARPDASPATGPGSAGCACILENVAPEVAMGLVEACHPAGVRVLQEAPPGLAGFRDRVALVGDRARLEAVLAVLPERGPLGTVGTAAHALRAALAAATDPAPLRWPDGSLDLAGRVRVMGILNVTPDSFSDGGRHADPRSAIDHALRMQEEGADLIDVGGESTRPGSDFVSLEEERRRVLPVIEALASRLRVPISVDTRKAAIAEEAVRAGARMVNDVSALEDDPNMAEVVAACGVPVVLMHRRGTPRTMQRDPSYEDPVAEILRELRSREDHALRHGIPKDRIVLDPGVGFGKRVRDNLEILARLEEFRVLGGRLLVGTSRKSFLGAVTGAAPSARLLGTAATVVVSALRGARIVRVHDVREMVEVVRVVDAIQASTGERD